MFWISAAIGAAIGYAFCKIQHAQEVKAISYAVHALTEYISYLVVYQPELTDAQRKYWMDVKLTKE